MRYSRLLPVTFIAVIMMVMASCTVVSEGYGNYREAPVSRPAYYADPYTGQLYLVSPHGFYSPFNSYGYGYGYPNYPNRGNYHRDNSPQRSRTSQVRPSLPKTQNNTNNNTNQQKFEDARRKVLGERRQ